ncbi:MAG: maleylpyruvate isomerase N-terminal domain-containing protein, partial [Acidimicrobiales bacterium]
MRFPGEQDLLDERSAVLVTLASLTDDEFESGPTLCAEWAPRDVLAHLMGIDHAVADYVKAKGNVGRANAEIVERARSRSRRELMASAESWATHPP